MTRINKLLSILNFSIILLFTIPDIIKMTKWLESGIMKSYFYLLAPVNLLIIVFGISLLYFLRKNRPKKKVLFLILNLVTLILSTYWAFYINVPA